jgi:Protein of unknown function (DUF3089)
MRSGLAVVVVAAAMAALVPAAAAKAVWLCKPGLRNNPCTSSMTATVETAAGPAGVQHMRPARRPRIDCFYVYPTVSGQPSLNATLRIDPEERAVAVNQASRFSQVCRVFAPMYRQLTVSGILSSGLTKGFAIAYRGVRAAWRNYLAHFNKGRGVVLIGHSQGTFMLDRLVQKEIDRKAKVRRQLVSALLIGGNVQVPIGRGVGGDFKHVPACTTGSETGCVVAYSTFNQVPPANSLFGRVPGSTTRQVLCVNPADLSGDGDALRPYFTTKAFPGPLGPFTKPVPRAPTPWVFGPNLYTAQCMNQGGASWLQVNDVGGPADPRPRVTATLGPIWGLHLADMQLPLGNLVDLVKLEAKAYVSRAG